MVAVPETVDPPPPPVPPAVAPVPLGAHGPAAPAPPPPATATANTKLLTEDHLSACYKQHQQQIDSYFKGRDDLLSINISEQGSFQQLLRFLELDCEQEKAFPHLNQGSQVSNWKAYKHVNKINSYSAGKEHRKFFDY